MNRPEKGEGFPGQRIVVLPRSTIAKAAGIPLLKNLLPTDIGLFPHAEKHLRERPEGVDQAIFIYCSKAGGWCEMRGQRHEIHESELLVIPPGEPHTYGANDRQPWTILWFHVMGLEVRLLLRELGVTAENPVVFLGEDPQVRALFEDALGVFEHGYAPAQLLLASRMLGHLIGLMIWRRGENWRGEPDARQKINRCIAYMKQHLDKPLRLRMVAGIANLSLSHFNVLFHRETGYSCMDYLTRLRIHQACQWLDTTDWAVKNIAARLSYEDPLHFSRVFRSIHGVSPREYRRLHKG